MVLSKALLTYLVLVAITLLHGCSSHPKSTVRPGIIPAQEVPTGQVDPPSQQVPPGAVKSRLPEKPHLSDEKTAIKEAFDTTDSHTNEPESAAHLPPRVADDSEFSLLEILLAKANKAIHLQQWLRAQRSLEQAIRLAPMHAQSFLLYGDVYAKLGSPEQAEEMYKRALYLAEHDSELRRLAQEKLNKE